MFFTDIHDLKSAERLTGIPQALLRYYIRTGRLPTNRMGNAYVMEEDKLVDSQFVGEPANSNADERQRNESPRFTARPAWET